MTESEVSGVLEGVALHSTPNLKVVEVSVSLHNTRYLELMKVSEVFGEFEHHNTLHLQVEEVFPVLEEVELHNTLRAVFAFDYQLHSNTSMVLQVQGVARVLEGPEDIHSDAIEIEIEDILAAEMTG
jgi:hypothetical protein